MTFVAVTSTTGDAPLTVTLSVRLETPISTLIEAVKPAPRAMSSRHLAESRELEGERVTLPGRQRGILYEPSS